MRESGIDVRVAAEVRAELARQQRTQIWLSAQTGIGRPGLSKRLSGLQAFTIAELDRVATALNVPIGDLIGLAA